jgi:hypothetical protein
MYCLITQNPKNISMRILYVTMFLLSAALIASAQGVGSSRGLTSGDGNNTIQGKVYFPAGDRNAGKTIKLHVESANATSGASTVTDQDGMFRFNGLRPGSYEVVVDGGKDYENTREPVTIDPVGGGRIIQISIPLKPKIDAANPAFAGVPKSSMDLYQKGMAAAQKGSEKDTKDAVDFLSKAVAAYPNFPQALSDLGNQYVKLFQWDKATEAFEALVKLKPSDPVAHLDLGIALYNVGGEKLPLADAQFREAIKLNSPGPSAHYYLGMTLVKTKRYPEAQTELVLAIKNGGDNIVLAHKYLGGLYLSAHKNKEAADELEKYLKLAPTAKDADKIKQTIAELRKGQ